VPNSSSSIPLGNSPNKKKNSRDSGLFYSTTFIEASKLNLKLATLELDIPSTANTSCISFELRRMYNSLRVIFYSSGAANTIACGLPPNKLNKW